MLTLFTHPNCGTFRNAFLGAAFLFFCCVQAAAQPTDLVKKLTRQHLEKSYSASGYGSRLSLNLLPASSSNYSPAQAGGWDLVSESTYAYNQAGQRTEEVVMQPGTQANLLRFTNAFDAQGYPTEEFLYVWENNAWQLDDFSLKIEYSYNAGNQVTSQEFKYYDRATATFENEFRSTYFYDASGRLTENVLENWNGTAWEVYARLLYSYAGAGAAFSEEIYQEYLNGTYQNSHRYAEIVWHNPAAWQPASQNSYTWTGNTWQLSGRENFSHAQSGSWTQLVENYQNTTWEPSRLDSVHFDSQQNYTGSTGLEWNGANWEIYWQDKELLTYNSNLDVTERIIRIYDLTSNTLQNFRKEVYNTFVSATPETASALPVSLFPNPAHSQLTLTGSHTAQVSVLITDLAGRALFAQNQYTGNNPGGIL